MTTTAFVTELAEKKITICLTEQGEVKCRAPRGVLTSTIMDELRRRKEELVAHLTCADFMRPNLDRRGLVRFVNGGLFQHFCQVCGAWGAYGYRVDLKNNRFGVWYCREHRPRDRRKK